MDGFRVIRDYADYANYAYETSANLGQKNATTGARVTAPWHDVAAAEQLGNHAFVNPFEDFGSRSSAAAITGQRGYAGAGLNMGDIAGGSRRGGGARGARQMGGRGFQRGDGGRGFQQEQQQQKKRFVRRREHTQYPYAPVADNMERKVVSITGNSAFCFHGYQSIFTLQHRFDFLVDGDTYKSVDQYYQLQKVKDLTGITSAKFTDGSTRDYSSLARDLLRQASIKRSDVENWRTSKGIIVIQKALLEKVRQCYDLRSAITSTGDKIIVQSFAGDDFYGAGVPAKFVKDWCSGLEKNKGSLTFPVTFPLTEETVKYVPVVGKGKNILGAIYMIIREKINAGQLDSLSVNSGAQVKGSGSGEEMMNIDFTVDSNS